MNTREREKKKNPLFSIFFSLSFLPQPTQFWCSSLTTVIFVATTVTTSAEGKLEIWWLFLWERERAQRSATLASVRAPATCTVTATVGMSHTSNELEQDLVHLRDSVEQTIRQTRWWRRRQHVGLFKQDCLSVGCLFFFLNLELWGQIRNEAGKKTQQHKFDFWFLI